MQHMHYISTTAGRLACVALFATVAGSACSSDSTGVSSSSTSQLAFMATGAGTANASVIPVTNGGHTLDLTGVTLTVSRAELKRAKNDACPGDSDEDDDHPRSVGSTESCGELKIGPTTVELPLTGTVVTLPANTIPAGTFREFELRVSQVQLKGTFDGKAFDVIVPVKAKSEIEFSTPLVVTEGTPASITVTVPTANWLVNSNGSLIDPATLGTSASLMAQVKDRIRASFRAFEDHDHDGHEDHGR